MLLRAAIVLAAGLVPGLSLAWIPGKAVIPQGKSSRQEMTEIAWDASRTQHLKLSALSPAAAQRLGRPESGEKRVRIGARRDLASELASSGGPEALEWVPVAGGVAARIAVTSPAAAALRLGLRIRSLPAGAELRVSGTIPGAVPLRVSGDAAYAEAREHGQFWTPVSEGDTQTVEIRVGSPSEAALVRLEVESASHLAGPPSMQFKSSGVGASQACHQDVACASPGNPALAQAARSVAKMVFTENGVSYLCTGTLVSDGAAQSQVPYLYTAAHCIGTQAAAATLNTFWFFEAAACGAKAAGQYQQLTGGATLLYANAASDAALVRLSERAPEGAWFSGWDDAPLAAGTALVGLHHPAGDLKKLALGLAVAPTDSASGGSYATAAWSTGSTEGGSSGSGLFTLRDGQYLLRGALRGGSASCGSSGHVDDPSNRDYYSRLDLEAPTLRAWLSGAVTPLDDYTGMWWNPDEPGWGVSVIQEASGKVFAAWYTYDANGPTWIVMPQVAWKTTTRLEGALYRARGTAFEKPYDASRFSVTPVGSGSIEFGRDTGTLTFVVDGKTVTKPLRRQAL